MVAKAIRSRADVQLSAPSSSVASLLAEQEAGVQAHLAFLKR